MSLHSALKLNRPQLYTAYLVIVSLVGATLAAAGVVQFTTFEPHLNFLLLLCLAIAIQIPAISVPVSGKAGITYALGPAVTLAAVPLFKEPTAAALIEALTALTLWLIKPADGNTWKKSWQQLAFNVGMSTIAIYIAGYNFLLLQGQLGAETVVGRTVPYLVAAVVNDQVNLWLLIGILRLQNGKQVKPLEVWKENTWAMPIGILSISIGAGILAFAVTTFGWLGAVIFFLPIFLSTFADRLYVRQMQEHMNNLEAIVAERTKELAELMRQKDAFLAVLTHDMKTPLTTIGLYAEMLKRQPHMLVDKPHVSEIILRSQKTLTEIVNNILDLEKLQSGQEVVLQLEDFELVPIMEYMMEAITPHAQTKNITLDFVAQPDSIPLRADRAQLERVFANLLSNAVKYTPNGGDVHVEVCQENGHAKVEIADSGYGIPADELPTIFEPFRRVHKHRDKAAGTGLGLAIVKALVEAHGGKIAVHSEEGVGSTFTVTLPTYLKADLQPK